MITVFWLVFLIPKIVELMFLDESNFVTGHLGKILIVSLHEILSLFVSVCVSHAMMNLKLL
jgi:hypothetical protein